MRYKDTKGQTIEAMNKVMEKEWQFYIEVMEAHVKKEDKDNKEHIQQMKQHNAILIIVGGTVEEN